MRKYLKENSSDLDEVYVTIEFPDGYYDKWGNPIGEDIYGPRIEEIDQILQSTGGKIIWDVQSDPEAGIEGDDFRDTGFRKLTVAQLRSAMDTGIDESEIRVYSSIKAEDEFWNYVNDRNINIYEDDYDVNEDTRIYDINSLIYDTDERLDDLLTEFEAFGLSELQKDLIKEIALADFECGHFTTEEFFLEDCEGDFEGAEQEAANYYRELVEMGPAGFYEEFADELDFSDDFVAEYGELFENASNDKNQLDEVKREDLSNLVVAFRPEDASRTPLADGLGITYAVPFDANITNLENVENLKTLLRQKGISDSAIKKLKFRKFAV